jgi:methionyl-tRNA formyltransferase
MMGTGTFAEPTFEALLAAFPECVVGLFTQPEREGVKQRGSTRQTGKGMATIARAANVPVAQPESVNAPDGLAQLQEMRPDLLVVAAYGQILSKDVLSAPARGTINVHASLLPKYRGAAPVAYSILNGDSETGVTIIKVTPGLDSGDMISQEAIPIAWDDTTGTLEAKLAALGARMAVDAARKYATGGAVEGTSQDATLVTKAPKIKKEFGLIDWTKPAAYIERFVRAMQPWPTAYTFLHRPGKEPMRVIVNAAQLGPACPCGPNRPAPGTIDGAGKILDTDVTAMCVWVGQNVTLFVTELQPAGKKKMSAEEFLRGYPIVEGMRFGPEVLA